MKLSTILRSSVILVSLGLGESENPQPLGGLGRFELFPLGVDCEVNKSDCDEEEWSDDGLWECCIRTSVDIINTRDKVYMDENGWLVGRTFFESYAQNFAQDHFQGKPETYFRYKLYGMLPPGVTPGDEMPATTPPQNPTPDKRCDGGVFIGQRDFFNHPETVQPVKYDNSRQDPYGIERQNEGIIMENEGIIMDSRNDEDSLFITSVWIMISINDPAVHLAARGDKYDFCVLGEHLLNQIDRDAVDLAVDSFSTRFTGAIKYEGNIALEEVVDIADIVEVTATGDITEKIDISACLTLNWEDCSEDQKLLYRVGEDFGILLSVPQVHIETYEITQIQTLYCSTGGAAIELISEGLQTNVLTMPYVPTDGSSVGSSKVYVRSVVQIGFFGKVGLGLECFGSVKLQLKGRRSRELEYEMEHAFSSVSRGMQKAEEGSFRLSIFIQDEIDEAAGAGGNAGVATAATAAAFFVGILLV